MVPESSTDADARMEPFHPSPNSHNPVRFSSRPGWLVAEANTPNGPRDVLLACWAQVVKECQQRQCNRVVVIHNNPSSLTCFDMYDLIERLQKMKPPGLKVAFVDPHPGRRAVGEFGDTVAVNRGLSARCFDNMPAAEAWLGASA